jgi:CRP/FNR family transcriptional regulator
MADESVNTEFLGEVALFRELDVNQLAEILLLGVVKEYRKDDVIFEDGSPGDRFYVIYRGAVRISKVFDNLGEEALTILKPGDFLGEMSFFEEEPRSAKAVAHEDCQLLEIRNEDLRAHLDNNSDVALRFLWAFCRTLSKRVRETNEKFSVLFAISRVF